MSKAIIGGTVLVIIAAGALWWIIHRSPSSPVARETSPSLTVVTTFYPLQQLAGGVVGDLGTVSAVVPVSTEPHDFEPTPTTVKALYDADVVVLNGAGLDPWAEKLLPDLEERGITTLILANQVELLRGEEDSHEDEAGGDTSPGVVSTQEPEEETAFDPHFWLDPVIAIALTERLASELSAKFPEHQATWRSNQASVKARLAQIDVAYRAGLAQCRLREAVTAHNAFAYLAKRYAFETHALSGLSPEAEPSPKRLAEIAAEAKAEGIKYIFFETLVNPKLSETLAREVGAETLVFNPIEGVTAEEAKAGVTYFTLMEDNLSALRKALECQ